MPEIPVIPYKKKKNRTQLFIKALQDNPFLKALVGPVKGNPGKRTMTKKDQQNRINKTPTKKKKKTTPEDKYPSNRSY
jgi:hypothetical protein